MQTVGKTQVSSLGLNGVQTQADRWRGLVWGGTERLGGGSIGVNVLTVGRLRGGVGAGSGRDLMGFVRVFGDVGTCMGDMKATCSGSCDTGVPGSMRIACTRSEVQRSHATIEATVEACVQVGVQRTRVLLLNHGQAALYSTVGAYGILLKISVNHVERLFRLLHLVQKQVQRCGVACFLVKNWIGAIAWFQCGLPCLPVSSSRNSIVPARQIKNQAPVFKPWFQNPGFMPLRMTICSIVPPIPTFTAIRRNHGRVQKYEQL